MRPEKILIAVSDDAMRECIKEALEEHYPIVEAKHGFEAIRLTRNEMPEMVIIDVETEGLNGIDFCRRLKSTKNTRNILIVLVFSHTNKEEIVYGLQAGADDYFTFPLTHTEVLNRVDAHLRYADFLEGLEYNDLKLILELSNKISVIRNPKKILKLVVDRVAEIIGVDRCSIVNISEDDSLSVKASNDLEIEEEIELDLDSYPEIRKAFETRNTVVVSNTTKDRLMEPVRSQMKERGLNSIIVVPIIKKESVIGSLFLGTATKTQGGISERGYKLCQLVANISANALENAVLFESMATAKDVFEDFVTRDGLTRLYSHRHFYEQLEKEFSRTGRYKTSLSLVQFNVDGFREINNKYGHIQGDEILKQIGRLVRSVVRDTDVAARYAGDEFSILLPNTNKEGALTLASRLKNLINDCDYGSLTDETVTISAGIVNYEGECDGSYDLMVQAANEAMKKAKQEGKNRIVVSDDLSS